tara:strand:+ start:146 stop:256 length:111 start_codon:yes stop_codon:yes gene_type:complete
MSSLTDKYTKNYSPSKKGPNPQGLNIPIKKVKTIKK